MKEKLSRSEAGKLGAIASSKTLHIRKQKRIDDYNDNPKLCKFCEQPIVFLKRYNDFCNQSCGASFNNKGHRKHGNAPIECKACGTKTTNDKFCNQLCMIEYNWNNSKNNLLSTGVDKSSTNRLAKRYLIELHKGKCQICLLNTWQDKPMPLVLDHIDGNPYNDLLINLRVICNNCDALTDTFKGRNKGSGRFSRAIRYKFEKESTSNIEGFKSKIS